MRRWLPKIASGEAIGTLALVEGPGDAAPAAIRSAVRGGKLRGVKTFTPDGEIADFAIVAARGEGGDVGLFVVDRAGRGVSRTGVESVDPSRNHAEIVFEDAVAEPLGAAKEGWAMLTRALDRAAALMAFEQVGGADRALEMARDYALDRMAFGRPIGSFQAIKHMLADMYVANTLARSNAYYGGLCARRQRGANSPRRRPTRAFRPPKPIG